MARGNSGKVVINVDPQFKEALYLAVTASGSTLKDWFIHQGRQYIDEQRQPILLRVAETSIIFGAKKLIEGQTK